MHQHQHQHFSAASSPIAPPQHIPHRAFQVNPSPREIAIGSVEQWRRSKLSRAWKSVVLSLVKSPSYCLCVWREVVSPQDFSASMEVLQQIPINAMEWIEFCDYAPGETSGFTVEGNLTDQQSRFSIRLFNAEELLTFRCPDEPEAVGNWVTSIRTVINFVKTKPKDGNPVAKNAYTASNQQRNNPQQPDIDLLSMDYTPNSAAAAAINRRTPGVDFPDLLTGTVQSSQPNQHSYPYQQAQQHPRSYGPPSHQQPSYRRGPPQGPGPSYKNAPPPPRQQPPASAQQQHFFSNRQQPLQHNQYLYHQQNRQASNGPNHYTSSDPSRSVTPPPRTAPSTMQTQSNQKPKTPATSVPLSQKRPTSRPTNHVNANTTQPQRAQTQTQRKPAIPSHQPPTRRHSAPPPKTATTQQAHIKQQVLQQWALQPPAYQQLKSLTELICTFPRVFPPPVVASHVHFSKWQSTNVINNQKELDKCVRKLKFLLHPDKLPSDFNAEQTYLCQILWDIIHDAIQKQQQ